MIHTLAHFMIHTPVPNGKLLILGEGTLPITGEKGRHSATLPETNSLHLQMDGWNTSFLLGWPFFTGLC